jgi:6-pyruvoyltetrahydropterin/6-carboxytetrahydropterin synthase
MRICREFTFDAAHYISDYKGKCERMHGHTYKLEVTIEGPIRKDGMVMDFTILKDIVEKEVLEALDHVDLNEVMENPTAENLVEWSWKRLKGKLPLYSIRIWEGEGKWAEKVKA